MGPKILYRLITGNFKHPRWFSRQSSEPSTDTKVMSLFFWSDQKSRADPTKMWKKHKWQSLRTFFRISRFLAPPWKVNMEPTNHPFRKEYDLPSLHEDMFQPFIFRGVCLSKFLKLRTCGFTMKASKISKKASKVLRHTQYQTEHILSLKPTF